MAALAGVLAARRAEGHEVVLVSSGAIAAGLEPLGLPRRPRDLATQQAAASVGQGLLVARYAAAFAAHGLGVGQVLLTAEDVIRRSHYANARRTLYRLLQLGVVPVVNENDTVATDEIRFGDNDRLAALVAHLVHADALVLLTDVDALYDRAPSKPGAQRVAAGAAGPTTSTASRSGRPAATSAPAAWSPRSRPPPSPPPPGSRRCSPAPTRWRPRWPAPTSARGSRPTGSRRASRLLWLAHATRPRGRLTLDAGAVAAVVERRMSLLPAGVNGVAGDFAAGDPVDLCDENGHAVARGLVNYASAELPGLLGRSTRELARELGPAYEREVVHRDDLVLLR